MKVTTLIISSLALVLVVYGLLCLVAIAAATTSTEIFELDARSLAGPKQLRTDFYRGDFQIETPFAKHPWDRLIEGDLQYRVILQGSTRTEPNHFNVYGLLTVQKTGWYQ